MPKILSKEDVDSVVSTDYLGISLQSGTKDELYDVMQQMAAKLGEMEWRSTRENMIEIGGNMADVEEEKEAKPARRKKKG